MEVLNVLEKKIAGLIELIKELKLEKALLAEENVELKEKLEKIESSLLLREQNAEERSQEIVLTKMVVDDLIKSIDLLVEQEPQQ
jgi:hypothetical protein